MATYYLDASRPDDTGAGTSMATAKKTYANALALCTNGDTLKIRAGRCYDHTGSDFDKVRFKSNITIEPYDLPTIATRQDQWDHYPILDGLVWENSGSTGWTHEGDGVWSKSFGGSGIRRIWFGSHNGGVLNSQRTLGTAYSRTPNATADVLATIKTAIIGTRDRWHVSGAALGNKLYVYTGSTTVNPPTFYGGLAMCMNTNIGTYACMQVNQSNNITVRKIHARGGLQNCFFVQSLNTDTFPTHDILFEDCLGSCMYAAGFSARPGSVNDLNKRMIWNVRFIRCVGDMKTSQYEQDPTVSYTWTAQLNMYEITGTTHNCFAIDCESYNAGHVSIVVGLGFDNRHTPENCGFIRHYSYWDSWASYARGASTNRGNNIFIIGCTFDGQNVQSQIVDGYIVSNKWVNMRDSIRKAGTDGCVSFEVYAQDWNQSVYGNDRYVMSQPRRLIFANNLIVDNKNQFQCLQFTTYGGSGYPVPDPDGIWQSMWIANNLIIDRIHPTRPWIAGWHNGGSTIWTQAIVNNIVWTDGGGTPFAKWGGVTKTLNTCPGESGTIVTNPLINETTWKVSAGSPAIGAGYHVGYYPDGEGKYFNPKPSIGLYEQDAVVVTRNPRV